MTLKVGDTIPEGVFPYIPYDEALEDSRACGMPSRLKTEQWKGKKIVLIGLPGAFTRTCSGNHLPPYIEKAEEFKKKGVDQIYAIASNDLFVMSGFGRFNKAGPAVEMLSDPDARWAKEAGLSVDLSAVGLPNLRLQRFTLVIDDLIVKEIGIEENGNQVTSSSADAILAKL
ncbi:Redoxin [Atractiella rhizophila]|nr:Redoxin [Atractiella rhizophila]